MSPVPIEGDPQGRVAPVLLQDTPRAAERRVLGSDPRAAPPTPSRFRGAAGRQAGSEPGHLLLELVGQEQELVPREAPDVESAETVELTVDLLLADPRPPPDTEDEDGRPDARIIGAGEILEDREQQRKLPTIPADSPPSENPERETRKGSVWGGGRAGEGRAGPRGLWQKGEKQQRSEWSVGALLQSDLVLRTPQTPPRQGPPLNGARSTGTATHDLRDPGSDQIHLVHVGSQHVEVPREGGLSDGASTTWTENPEHSGTGRRPRPCPRPGLRLWRQNRGVLPQTAPLSSPHSSWGSAGCFPH